LIATISRQLCGGILKTTPCGNKYYYSLWPKVIVHVPNFGLLTIDQVVVSMTLKIEKHFDYIPNIHNIKIKNFKRKENQMKLFILLPF
jgi:hypothetical protein